MTKPLKSQDIVTRIRASLSQQALDGWSKSSQTCQLNLTSVTLLFAVCCDFSLTGELNVYPACKLWFPHQEQLCRYPIECLLTAEFQPSDETLNDKTSAHTLYGRI